MISNKQKALIHVAKAQVGMSEEEYRAMLLGFGVSSSKDLQYRQFDGVMKRFEGLGFKGKKVRRAEGEKVGSKEKLTGKIRAICAEMGLTPRYVNAIAKNMFGVGFLL